ncbi:MAG: SLBB domain-containing protein [Cytophagales bacterium]|nr:SLBB domain-containing protein [Cytophagales bacterium]
MHKRIFSRAWSTLVVMVVFYYSQGQDFSALAQRAIRDGYSIEQLEQLARQNGLNASQIADLRSQVFSASPAQNQPVNPVRDAPVITNTSPPQIRANSASTGGNVVFGINIFRSQNLTFQPNLNLPTPTNYILGPGDEINVELWGKTELTMNLVVRPDGFIKPTNLGPVYVNGLSIQRVRSALLKKLNSIYQGLIPDGNGNASTFALITLSQIRSINVTVVGDVVLPGDYTLNSLSTVYTALHACGGPTPNGTMRAIELIRDGKIKSKIDIYGFLTDGIKENDELLRQGDVILVKPYLSRVEVRGEFKKPGFYELRSEETLADLIRFASGFTDQARRDQIIVERIESNGLNLIELDSGDLESFQLNAGDAIRARTRNAAYTNRVVIEGAVKQPGTYPLEEDMTLKDLITKAMGLRGDAFETQVFVYRLNDKYEQELITLDLSEIMNGTRSLKLAPEDVVEIKSIYGLSQEPYLQITGQIRNPGLYPFLKNTTLKDLIYIAGGLQISANQVVEITRSVRDQNELDNDVYRIDLENSSDFELTPFDRVHVKRKPGTLNEEVLIVGEINSPGRMSILSSNERLSSIVSRAEGFTPKAYPKGAILVRRSEFYSGPNNLNLDLENLQELRSNIFENSGVIIGQGNPISSRKERISSINENSGTSPLFDVRASLINTSKDSLLSSSFSNYEVVAIDLDKAIENPGSESDIFVKTGDIISIPTELQTVRVSGAIRTTMNLKFEENKSFKQYVGDAGGFLKESSKRFSAVLYPNGKMARVKRFLFFRNYPDIEPGSTIIVGRKGPRTPFNLGNTITSVGSVVGLILLIQRL